MGLPVLPIQADIRNVVERVNPLIRLYNRPDLFVPSYAADTGSGTAYAIAPSGDITFLVVGQIFAFQALNANTGTAPTLNVGGLGAGVITRIGGAALVAGDIPAGGFVIVECTNATTPTFQLLSPTAVSGVGITNTGATAYQGGNVALNNTVAFFDGPTTGAIGAAGWKVAVSAVIYLSDTAGAALLEGAIFDGTAYIAAGTARIAVANEGVQVSLPPVVVTLAGATTFTVRAKDQTSTSGLILTTGNVTATGGNATYITWVRIS